MNTAWDIVDSAATADGTVLVLVQAGDIWEVRVDHHLLMASDDHRSEEALSSLALAKMPSARRVLIGGLGMGFTLRSALDRLPPNASVIVAEMSPALVGWNRTVLKDLAQAPLVDPRVELRMGDVGERIREVKGGYDVILLDVDNGPEGIVHETNDSLYNDAGVRDCFDALSDGGVVAIWSAGGDDGFVARLRKAGFVAEAVSIDDSAVDRGPDDERHVVFVAQKPSKNSKNQSKN